MPARWRLRAAAAALLLAASAGVARAGEVALTFDDLPTLQLPDDQAYAELTTIRLVQGLRRHRIPATGFVIGDKLEGPEAKPNAEVLRQWLAAGFVLGNHTWDHPSLDKEPLAAYIAGVAQTDDVLKPLLAPYGQRPRWFRYPYLETGGKPGIETAFQAWLAKRGYRNAPVTIENSDWMFALPYDEAVLRHDAAAARRVKTEYLDYTEKAVAWYRLASWSLFGRPIAFVFLLHATRLNADCLDDLAAIFKANDLTPLSLSEALKDPAYAIPDHYVGA
ncbi:MAG: polysaccharide deacetylase family protein, partial [Alphaproteobacteria bacterium]|nr:polysaccharide deacetylase family protein [Alphaproteobacteria bacterium]